MTIEAKIEENTRQLRQLLLCNESILQVIQSLGGKVVASDDGKPTGMASRMMVITDDSIDGAPTITAEDFGELDEMDCPYDPSIMAAGKTRYGSGHKLAGCWKKKKDKAYTEEMYIVARRVLIEKVKAARLSTSDQETEDDSPPQTANTAPPPPPMTAVNEDVTELPSVPNFDTITTEEFTELCRIFILKHGGNGAHYVRENMKKCGFSPDIMPDQVMQQDQLTWITKRIVDHDEANS